jgi:hypothetical protein
MGGWLGGSRNARATMHRRARGASLPELMVVIGLVGTLAAVSLPPLLRGVDAARVRAGARYLGGRLHLARMLAVMRSQYVALRFEPVGQSYRIGLYADGNGNGLRTIDIDRGVDRPLGPPERLEDQFASVRLGIVEPVPAVDGHGWLGPSDSPVRVGRSGLVSFSPLGTATSGTLYVRGRGLEQYAVRVLGPTGRIRVLRFDRATKRWREP